MRKQKKENIKEKRNKKRKEKKLAPNRANPYRALGV
jgi:hypothetical protein